MLNIAFFLGVYGGYMFERKSIISDKAVRDRAKGRQTYRI